MVSDRPMASDAKPTGAHSNARRREAFANRRPADINSVDPGRGSAEYGRDGKGRRAPDARDRGGSALAQGQGAFATLDPPPIVAGRDERIYTVGKIATLVDALNVEGVPRARALEGLDLSEADLRSPETRVSLDQVVRCCSNAEQLSEKPHFGFLAGLRFHVSTYGLYGFAILCCPTFREGMNFAIKYRQLETPITHFDFREAEGSGIWTFVPIALPEINGALYRFIVELHLGICLSLHRNSMGPSFALRELRLAYAPGPHDAELKNLIGCPTLFDQRENALVYDARWLDRAPEFGNALTFKEMRKLCDRLLEEMQLREGVAGEVRGVILSNLARATSLETVAVGLNIPIRTLKRKLQDEGTNFRKIVDQLRMELAIRYLRDTDLTVEEIAATCGFSDAANFRHAFRRWTNATPNSFRRAVQDLTKG